MMNKEGWKYCSIGDVFSTIKNGANIRQIKGAKGVPITRIETLSNGIFNADRLGYANINNDNNYTSYYLNDGDILMSHINSLEYVGRAVVYHDYIAGPLIHGMNLLRLIPNNINSDYCAYYFKTAAFKKDISSITHKSVNQASFNITNLKTLLLPVPPLQEQAQIVQYLDNIFANIDETKKKAEHQIAEAEKLFQSALNEKLQMRDGWKEMILGDFAHLKAGDFVKASDIYEKMAEGLYPCYGGNGLRGYVAEPNQKGEYCLIGRQGALCGNVNLAKGTFRTTEHAVVVKPYSDIPPRLTYYLLSSLNINQYATGAAQPGISVKNIEKTVKIHIPPKNEWKQIISTLDTISTKTTQITSKCQQIIADCDSLKQAILKQIFE